MEKTAKENPSPVNLNKVATVTLGFWIIKVLATTVGETAGDAFSMSLNLGYAVASLVFLSLFLLSLVLQIRARHFNPWYYWSVVVATTTFGTTLSDYLDRTLELGYIKSSILLSLAVVSTLILWRMLSGEIPFDNVRERRDELFYWLTILLSNTLGTALGDFVATSTGLGFERGSLVFASLLLLIAGLYRFARNVPRSILFWAAYALTRPLGATLGDQLTKPLEEGGFAADRFGISLAIAMAMVVGIHLSSREGG